MVLGVLLLEFGDTGVGAFAGINAVAPVGVGDMPQEPPGFCLVAKMIFIYQFRVPLHQHIAEVEDDVFHAIVTAMGSVYCLAHLYSHRVTHRRLYLSIILLG